jgi:hypothetical protein
MLSTPVDPHSQCSGLCGGSTVQRLQAMQPPSHCKITVYDGQRTGDPQHFNALKTVWSLDRTSRKGLGSLDSLCTPQLFGSALSAAAASGDCGALDFNVSQLSPFKSFSKTVRTASAARAWDVVAVSTTTFCAASRHRHHHRHLVTGWISPRSTVWGRKRGDHHRMQQYGGENGVTTPPSQQYGGEIGATITG